MKVWCSFDGQIKWPSIWASLLSHIWGDRSSSREISSIKISFLSIKVSRRRIAIVFREPGRKNARTRRVPVVIDRRVWTFKWAALNCLYSNRRGVIKQDERPEWKYPCAHAWIDGGLQRGWTILRAYVERYIEQTGFSLIKQPSRSWQWHLFQMKENHPTRCVTSRVCPLISEGISIRRSEIDVYVGGYIRVRKSTCMNIPSRIRKVHVRRVVRCVWNSKAVDHCGRCIRNLCLVDRLLELENCAHANVQFSKPMQPCDLSVCIRQPFHITHSQSIVAAEIILQSSFRLSLNYD